MVSIYTNRLRTKFEEKVKHQIIIEKNLVNLMKDI